MSAAGVLPLASIMVADVVQFAAVLFTEAERALVSIRTASLAVSARRLAIAQRSFQRLNGV